ncbi:unnamed protein product [Zymoseptoria tritici ST99CH_3D1]|nr:unnamed protein product [Zymoseptoria tritici ST99CH_3D1]
MDSLRDRLAGKPWTILGLLVALAAAYFVVTAIQHVLFSPLKHIPGPRINALSRIPYIRHMLAGTTAKMTVDLHKQYGEVVRISPDEVSFISGETAWGDIYGFRTGKLKGHLNTQKDPAWFPPPVNGAPSILLAKDEQHSKGRRLLSNAFSEKALTEQEPLVNRYVDQLVDGLRDTIRTEKKPVDMAQWYNWTTFDIIADLLFGEPFGCLQNKETHKYIAMLLEGLKAIHFTYIFRKFPLAKHFMGLLVDKKTIPSPNVRVNYQKWISSQVQKRIDRETQRPDFMSHILANNGEKGYEMSRAELDSNAQLFINAGSETTATLLSGATYALCRNPRVLEKLKKEVRGRWNNYHDINVAEVSKAPYLAAVISEALRYFPPVPAGFNRKIPEGGEVVSGYYLPGGTSTTISQYAAYHSEMNFKDPDAFIPERWLDDPKYANDKRSACQPFSFGPRNCLGKNLAYAELRLIVAKMIWTFDMELDAASNDWLERCQVFTLWWKPALLVKLTEAVRD